MVRAFSISGNIQRVASNGLHITKKSIEDFEIAAAKRFIIRQFECPLIKVGIVHNTDSYYLKIKDFFNIKLPFLASYLQ